MLKTLAQLESIVEGKFGRFLLDHDAPIHIAKEMCLQFLKHICNIEDNAKAQAEQVSESAKEEQKPDESNVVNLEQVEG